MQLIDHSAELIDSEVQGNQPFLGKASLLPALESVLFPAESASDAGTEQVRTYALLDSSIVTFLSDRLDMSGLPHACLYSNDAAEDLSIAAPWLVELQPESRLTRELLTPAGADDNPRYLFDRRPGIVLHAPVSLPVLRHHLRHYTMLLDEFGVREIFRLQEPGFLPALLDKCSPAEISAFFGPVAALIHWRPALIDGKWEVLCASPAPGLPESDPDMAPVPLLGPAQRRGLREALFERQARDMAMAHTDIPAERAARADVYLRLYCAGFDGEPTFAEAYMVVRELPPKARPDFWATVESGENSLRFILVQFVKEFDLDGVLQ
ncbi:MAG: DUF4123 domain-containing protein [Paracoccus sp. (in: a-proteobacteria)]|nr:DUF4123 domain-containing protein [Paracoccus sp. (in: a-proteobacteria)]